jgi:hypothetical protein
MRVRASIITALFLLSLGVSLIASNPAAAAKHRYHRSSSNFPVVVFVMPVTTSTVSTLPADYAAWTRVANCEEGGWIGYSGPAYPDSLGINATNWYAFGGGSDVSPVAQIAVADRLIEATGSSIPDQNGCAAW